MNEYAASRMVINDNLVDALRWRAMHEPNRCAYTFLVDGELQEENLTYGELDLRARAIGAHLQQHGAAGERVMLLAPPGLDYVAAFVGCLYAGAIAVPAYPPDPARLARTLPRLQALIADAAPVVALSTSLIVSLAGALAARAPELGTLRWLAIDDAPATSAASWREPAVHAGTLAFLQYTSGSTAVPKGVMLTHGNLIHNSAAISRCFGHSRESCGVIWLPPYHDMGLIGGVLQPLFGGFPVVLMSPLDFLRKPLRWLEAISRHRATTSGGPNFAYDLCVRKISPEDRARLDLSSWALAFNGAEPIHAETMNSFADAFAPHGFRKEAFYPCYGLAEATLIASGGTKGAPAVTRSFHKRSLDEGVAVSSGDRGGDEKVLVSSGRSLPDQQLLVVDLATRTPAPDGRIGEIWVAGPSISRGYFRRPEETALALQATLIDGSGPFLRTGDLGVLVNNDLFVTGRLKDLIILRGQNHYPQDLERTAERSHPSIRPGCSAAFSVEAGGDERLVLVLEIDPRATAAHVVDAVRRAIASEHEVGAYAVVLTATGAVPKTSSGKVQRHECKAQFLADRLEVLAHDTLDEAAAEQGPAVTPPSRANLLALSPTERVEVLTTYLRARTAQALGLAPAMLDGDRPLVTLGLDSLKAVELANALEVDFGVRVSLSALLGDRGLSGLVSEILASLHSDAGPSAPSNRSPRPAVLPLSSPQERLLFLDQLEPGNPAYTIPVAVRLRGPLDAGALERSLTAIRDRHEALRTTFTRADGRTAQRIGLPGGAPGFDLAGSLTDLRSLPEVARDTEVRRLAHEEARRPFNLAWGPLLRARLLHTGDDEHVLLLTLHHIVSDGWSMGVLVRELGEHYGAFAHGIEPRLAPLPIQYADFALEQRRRLDDGGFEADLAYWKAALAGAPALTSLPADRARPDVQGFAGAEHGFPMDASVVGAIAALARSEGATLFMALFAGFAVAFRRAASLAEVIMGTDVANREHASTEGLIGLFVNQLVLRLDLGDMPTFRALLRRARAVVLAALAHGKLPFDRLVEAVRPTRSAGHNPLFQVMFVLENAPMPPLALDRLSLELLSTEGGGSPFDLSVLLAPADGGLRGVLRYRTDLYDPATVARLAFAFEDALTVAAADPDADLAAIDAAIDARERRRRLDEAERLRAARVGMFRGTRRKASAE